jgi:hypothetical protein
MSRVWAQYPPKMSTTGPEAAESRLGLKKLGQGRSTIKLGPLNFSISTALNESFNDNIGLSEENEQSDLITTPSLGINIGAALTPLNTLSANIKLGYEQHAFHPELDHELESFIIDPNSNIDFTFYTSGVIFNIYDRPSIQQDPVSVPQLSNLTTFRRATNTLGGSMEWDLNAIYINASYARDTFHSYEDQFGFLDHDSDSLALTAGYRISPVLSAGLTESYTLTNYDDNTVQNGSNSYSTGFFVNTKLTEYLSAAATLSFQGSDFERGGRIGDNTDFGSVVYSLSLQNQLNRWISHSISWSRFTTLGIGSNFTEIHLLTYQASLDLFKSVTTAFVFGTKFLNDSASLSAEKATQCTFGPQFAYQVDDRLSFNLSYTYTRKESDRIGNNYAQNSVALGGSYNFY